MCVLCVVDQCILWHIMALIDCQFDYIWNELLSINGGHTSERFSVWFELGESTFSLYL